MGVKTSMPNINEYLDSQMKAFFEGFRNRWHDGLLWPEQLYRYPILKKAMWRLGWIAAFICFARARTNRKKRFGPTLEQQRANTERKKHHDEN